MMKNSSKTDMNQVFDHLAAIKTVEPDEALYARIALKIGRKNVIPMVWVRAAACLLILFVAAAIYMVTSKSKSDSNDISIVIYKTNNILYNE